MSVNREGGSKNRSEPETNKSRRTAQSNIWWGSEHEHKKKSGGVGGWGKINVSFPVGDQKLRDQMRVREMTPDVKGSRNKRQ